MASNSNEWAPLPQRKRPDKRTRDNQAKVLAQLKEMFGTSFEADIIATVASHCQYKLEAAIETMITLSSQSASQPSNAGFLQAQPAEDDLWQADEFPSTAEDPWLEAAATEEELRKQHEQFQRFEEARSCSGPARREHSEGEDVSDDEEEEEQASAQAAAGRQAARKVGTASLCGLKVQYRPKGIDYKSDDDADVVIEDEASDYKVEPEPISVCHFLATPTQCPPKTTFTKLECVSTASPPCTPRREPPPACSAAAKPLSAHEKHLQRIESDICKGWKVIVILRGVPGSGKSYMARNLVARTVRADDQNHIFSADHYFSQTNGGVFVFEASKLGDAHAYCQSRVANAARLGVSPIVVDNTNTQAWEMRPYAVMAVENGYIVETLEPNTPWSRKLSELEERNQHGVPKLKIQMMLDRYEPSISGDRLIRMFNLGYAPYNRPPQMRKLPPLPSPKPASTAPQQENALSTIAKEYSNLETLCKASDAPAVVKSTPLLSIQGNSFKEENLIDLVNLGAIGSERKNSNVEQQQVKPNEKLIDLPELGAIGSERKTATKEQVVKEETVKLAVTQPMSKLSLDQDETEMNTSGAFGSTEEEEDYFLDAEEMVSRDTGSSKNSAASSDHSTDFEKVDMIDFGANPAESKPKAEKSEANVVGLVSIFSFIKNSFLGSEKGEQQPTLSPKIDNEAAASKARGEPIDEAAKESEELTTNVIPIDEQEHDTLSQKLSNHHVGLDLVNRNLTINVQANMELLDEPRNDNGNVVQELLEACTEFQLVDTVDYSPTREEEDDESIISEKSFAQELKNLQASMKSKEEDSSAAKASINIILKDENNVLKEQQQNHASLPAEVQSDDNGNAVNNINLISWRESPFPVENVQQNPPENNETDAQMKLPESRDKETFTDPYDFNVAFIGADDFKVLEARNRSINEDDKSPISDEMKELGGGKLMLHKGTMTNTTGIFYSETIFDLEIDPQSEYRGEELVEKFSYIPRGYVLDVYDNLCKRDFGWATDYLQNLEFEDVVMAMSMTEAEKEKALDDLAADKAASSAEATVAKKAEPSKQRTSSSESSTSSPQRQLRKPRKNRQKNTVTQELERELQEKFVLSEESYPSHTLRVKRWKNRDFSPKRQAEQNLISFEEQAKVEPLTRLDHPAVVDDDQVSADESSSEEEESGEETMELKLGYEFIKVLEAEFGNPDFANSDGLFPVIQIRKSMAQELYALWIDSMQQQLWSMQEQLDAMIAKDAEYARTLEAEQDEDVEEAIGISEPEVPNLREIMDMEMALAMYSKDSIKDRKSMSHKQMETILTRDTLLEMFPDCDRDMIFEIYDAHDRNFDETVKVIKENCFTKCKLTMADILKKRKHLIGELQKQSRHQTSKHNDLEYEDSDEACGGEGSNQCTTYEDALEQAHQSRYEAQYQLSLRDENFKKAADAYQKKNPQVAAYYSDVAKLHIRNMEVANSSAASAFLAAQAHMLDAQDTLDLHFLRVVEAKQALQIYLDHQLSQLSPGGRKHIFIITGRGLRSVNGQSKIKPAVAKELNSKNLRFTEVNPGMLKVLLRKK